MGNDIGVECNSSILFLSPLSLITSTLACICEPLLAYRAKRFLPVKYTNTKGTSPMKQFPLSYHPIDYILSIHYQNYMETYGKASFEVELVKYERIGECHRTVENLIHTYGLNKINRFLDECVYRRAG